jgi:hypothetical protein
MGPIGVETVSTKRVRIGGLTTVLSSLDSLTAVPEELRPCD